MELDQLPPQCLGERIWLIWTTLVGDGQAHPSALLA